MGIINLFNKYNMKFAIIALLACSVSAVRFIDAGAQVSSRVQTNSQYTIGPDGVDPSVHKFVEPAIAADLQLNSHYTIGPDQVDPIVHKFVEPAIAADV